MGKEMNVFKIKLYGLYCILSQVNKSIIGIFIVFLLFSLSSWAGEGGISLGSTRVIYPAESKGESLSVLNSSTVKRYLIQSWVENESGNKTTDIIVTPPLYNSAPGSQNQLKIIATRPVGRPDREQLYYLNVKSIPAIDRKEMEGKNALLVTVNTKIKLFVRPKGLSLSFGEAAEKLQFYAEKNHLIAENPTPYYLTLTNIRAGGKPVTNLMIAPFSRMAIAPEAAAGVTYSVINDFGGQSEDITATVKQGP